MNCCIRWPPVVGNCLHLPETTRWPKVFSFNPKAPGNFISDDAEAGRDSTFPDFPIPFVLPVVRGIAQVMRNIKNHFRRKRTIRLISHRVNKLRGQNPKVCDSSLTKRILKKEIPLLNPDNANRVSLHHQAKIVNDAVFCLVCSKNCYLTAVIHQMWFLELLLGEIWKPFIYSSRPHLS